MNLYEYKILLVDDERALCEMVVGFLRRAGFHKVITAGSCREAETRFSESEPHLVLLDVMLPDGDGFFLFKKLRQQSEAPVFFLSARDEDESRLRGLGLGADDYITKPFLPEELILRVTAVLKRVYHVKTPSEEETVTLGNCVVDLASGVVHWKRGAESEAAENGRDAEKDIAAGKDRNGEDGAVEGSRGAGSDVAGKDRNGEDGAGRSDEEVTLTAKEYAILQKLAQERGRIVTIDALCDAVWQEENFGYENTLVVHIRRLREKIEEDPSHPRYLLTVRGLGYRLV